MRTSEERIAAMHQRAEEIKKEDRRLKTRGLQAALFAVCFAAAVFFAVFVSGLTVPSVKEPAAGIMNASIFSGSTMLGYVVVAVLAFFLGIMVTVFCFYLKKWQNHDDKKDTL